MPNRILLGIAHLAGAAATAAAVLLALAALPEGGRPDLRSAPAAEAAGAFHALSRQILLAPEDEQ